MKEWWGWVDVYDDWRMEVAEYGKQTTDGMEVTGFTVPENIAELMALIDLLPAGADLPGGSHKDVYPKHSTYYINLTDLQTEGETA